MSAAGYLWRHLNQKQREESLEWRKARGYPWQSPPHRSNFGHLRFLVSAACYEHRNPVRHGYVRNWTDWSWRSAAEYLAQTGTSEAEPCLAGVSPPRVRQGLG